MLANQHTTPASATSSAVLPDYLFGEGGVEQEDGTPIDLAEFRCTASDREGVVVEFVPTGRRYTYGWYEGDLALGCPVITGRCDPHFPEVIDCLARGVAFQASRKVPRLGH